MRIDQHCTHRPGRRGRATELTEINAQQNILKFERVRIHLLHGSVWFALSFFLVFPVQFFNLLPNNGTHSHFSKSTVIKCHYWTDHWHQQHFTNYHCLCVVVDIHIGKKLPTHIFLLAFHSLFFIAHFMRIEWRKWNKNIPNTSRINQWDKSGMHILKTHIAISDYCHRPQFNWTLSMLSVWHTHISADNTQSNPYSSPIENVTKVLVNSHL